MKTRFTILGSGSSLGIPRIDGYFGKCNPKIKQNFRSRCSALVTHDKFNILIDENSDLKRRLNVKNVPHTFIVDKTKKIVYEHTSYVPGDEELYLEVIEELNK